MIKLLIADDERASRMGVRYTIDWAAHGIEVVGEASNGQEALGIVKEYLPDILVTDIRMPVMDGLELAKMVRSFLPNIYIIMLSGYSDAEYMHGAIEVGANEYIFKSADSSNILETVLKGKAFIERKRRRTISDTLQKSVWNDSFPAIQGEFSRRAIASESLSDSLRKAAGALDVNLDGPAYLMALLCTAEKQPVAAGSQLSVRLAGTPTLVATPEDHLLVCIVNLEEGTKEVPPAVLAALKAQAAGQAQVFLSPVLPSFAQLRDAWPGIRQLAQAAFWFEPGHVAYQEELLAGAVSPEELDAIEARLLEALHRREHKVAQAILTEHQIAAQAACLPLEDFRGVLLRALALACAAEHELDRLAPARAALQACTLPGAMIGLVEDLLGPETAGVGKEIVVNAIRYIDEHFAERINLTQIAEKIFVSPNYLSQIFRNDMGIGIKEYISRKRIGEAQNMLTDGSLKYYEIAVKVGYRDYKHFSEHFLQYTGMSARQFQQTVIKTASGPTASDTAERSRA